MNWRYTGMEALQVYSCIIKIAKTFEKFLTSTFNWSDVTVWYVCSKPVILQHFVQQSVAVHKNAQGDQRPGK